MLALLNAEYYQLTRRKVTWLTLLLAVILVVIMTVSIDQLVDPDMLDLSTGNQVFLLAFMGGIYSLSIPLLYFTTAVAFNREKQDRLWINSVSFGFPRWQIYFSKFISIICYSTVFIAVGFATFVLMDTLQNGFIGLNYQVALKQLLAYIPYWLAYVALFLIFHFNYGGSLGKLLTVLILVTIVIAIFAPDFIASLVDYSKPLWLPSFYNYFFGMGAMFGQVTQPLPIYQTYLFLLAFLAIGLILFQRKEIK